MTQPIIFSVGTQVDVKKESCLPNQRIAHPAGSVAVIVRSPLNRSHSNRVKFNDGFEAAVHHDQMIRSAEFNCIPLATDILGEPSAVTSHPSQKSAVACNSSMDLRDSVIYRCVIGSRAYGLQDYHSDTERRGIYLAPAE